MAVQAAWPRVSTNAVPRPAARRTPPAVFSSAGRRGFAAPLPRAETPSGLAAALRRFLRAAVLLLFVRSPPREAPGPPPPRGPGPARPPGGAAGAPQGRSAPGTPAA